MELLGLCAICGKPAKLYTCSLCGKSVCAHCINLEKRVCIQCLGGKRKEEQVNKPGKSTSHDLTRV